MTELVECRLPYTLPELERYLEQFACAVLCLDDEGTVLMNNRISARALGYDTLERMELSTLTGLHTDLAELAGQVAASGGFLPALQFRDRKGETTVSACICCRTVLPDLSCWMLVLPGFTSVAGLSILQRFADSFMQEANLGVLVFSTDFHILDISERACRILGVSREDILDRPLDDIFASVPLDHQLVQRTILDGLSLKNHAVSWTNGEERYDLLMDSHLLRDPGGHTVGAYLLFKDVSNLRSLEEQVQRSDRLAMIGQIAAGTAHEIRNPLTSIKGFLQVLKRTLLDNKLEREYGFTEIMLTEIDRINELVSEFLLLSKPRNSRYVQVDVPLVMREILPIIASEGLLHDVTVQFECTDDLPYAIADRELLKQVFLNICKNGIEAMGNGGLLTVTLSVDRESGFLIIDIHDTGPGIPTFLVDKIFDPFFTTKEEGTGLGLAVCQRIVHDMGGTIRVSTKGYGTTFTVALPFAKG